MSPWWIAWALAQDVPVPEGPVAPEPRRTFDAREYEVLVDVSAVFNERLSEQDEELQALRQQLEARAIAQGLVAPGEIEPQPAPGTTLPFQQHVRQLAQQPPTPSVPPRGEMPRPPRPGGSTPRTSAPRPTVGDAVRPTLARAPTSLGQPLIFDVPAPTSKSATVHTTVVPAGSYVKVRILTGVEANASDEIPMLVQADHALVGPNQRRIDLTGCMVLLQVRGELSTDRVVGQAKQLSCVRDDGEHVSRAINGYLAGEDSTFGVTGQLISRQGRVLAAASVASLAEAAGAAVALAQETRQIVTNPLGGASQEISNVDGSDVAYVAGSSGSAAASLIANWYLEYADQLVPAIAVGSGRDVWVVLLETVEIPPLGG